MFRRRLGIGAVIALLLSASVATAQNPNEQAQVLDELRKIRQLLQLIEQMMAQQGAQMLTQKAAPRPAAPSLAEKVRVTTAAGLVMGKADAPLTMVEFTDMQCPFCSKFHVSVFEQIRKEYIDTGKLRYVSRDFPLEGIHPLALTGARAVRCAISEGKPWEMRHEIFSNNANLTATSFAGFARDLNLNSAAFENCLSDSDRFSKQIQQDLMDGAAAGVDGTPFFVIGRTEPDGSVNGARIVGAQPYQTFAGRLNELLGSARAAN